MQSPNELDMEDFVILEDSPVTGKDLLNPGEDLLNSGEDFLTMEKLTASEFKAACEKTIATCHLAKTKAEYRHSFTCFGKPTDENASLILLNVLCANTGNGKNSRKYDVLRRIDYLPKCKTDEESALQINKKTEALKIALDIKDETQFATILLTHNEGKQTTHSTLYLDKRKLTGSKLCQAIKAAGCREFLDQSRPLDNRNAVVRLLKIMEKDLFLAFRVLSYVFDLNIHAGDKTGSVFMTFLQGFMWSFVAGNIFSTDSNLYILTRKYWEELSEGLGQYCIDNKINLKELHVIRKNMFLFNSGCPEASPFVWYPDSVIKDLKNLSNALNRLPNSQNLEVCSKLNHLLEIFDLKTRNLWLSHSLSPENMNFLYVSAMLNGFSPLVAQINDAPFITSLPVAKKGIYTLPIKTRGPLIVDPVFCTKDESIQYKTKSARVVHHEATSDGRECYPAYDEVEYNPLIKLPFDLWWSCANFVLFQNDYDSKSEGLTTYVGLPELCFGSIPKDLTVEWSNFLKIPHNSKLSPEDLNSICHIAYYGNLLSKSSNKWSLISDVHTAIPQAKLLISKIMEHQASCSIPEAKAYVNQVLEEFLRRAAVNKQYPLVTFIATYQKTPQDMGRIAQQLYAEEGMRDAGMMLKKELPVLASMEWWFALSQIADTAPKEVKQHIFGFFSAVCVKEQKSVALEIEPMVPK